MILRIPPHSLLLGFALLLGACARQPAVAPASTPAATPAPVARQADESVAVDIRGVSVTFPRAPTKASSSSTHENVQMLSTSYKAEVGDLLLNVVRVEAPGAVQWDSVASVDGSINGAIEGAHKQSKDVVVNMLRDRPVTLGDFQGRDVELEVTNVTWRVRARILAVSRMKQSILIMTFGSAAGDPVIEAFFRSVKSTTH